MPDDILWNCGMAVVPVEKGSEQGKYQSALTSCFWCVAVLQHYVQFFHIVLYVIP